MQTKVDIKYIRWFANAAKPYKWTIAASIVCHLLLVVLALAYVYVSKALVDIATGNTESAEMLGISGMRSGLIAFGLAMIGVIVFRTLLMGLKGLLQTKASVKLRNALRQKQFDGLMRLSGDVRGKFHSGDILNRIQDDSSTAATTSCSTLPNLIGTACQFIAAFIYLVSIEARLAWVLVIVLPVGIIGGKYLMKKMKNLTLDVKKNDSKVQSHVQESVQHQTLIKTLEYDAESSATLSGLQDELYEKTMKRTRFTMWARVTMGLSMSGGYAIAFLWGVVGIYHGTVTYGLMTAFLQLVGQLQRPLIQMGDELPTIFHSTASIDRLEELNDLPQEDVVEPEMIQTPAGIRVRNLRFRYSDGTVDVFENFSHDFKPGTKTAIVGHTGIGKSTLIKLMLSLEKPSDGELSVYGTDGTEKIISAATRCNMVYVPQGNSLFSGTIRDNLRMGKPNASEAELTEALKLAAADFVLDLPKGMDTQCFEAGGGLSEGQAQRIAVARALLRPGSILLLDEFSSALDEATETMMLERLTAKENGKTMIFITHRQKVSEFCDDILNL